jgi:hypothetical protein
MTPQEKQIQDMNRMLRQHSALLDVAIRKISNLEKTVSSLKRELDTVQRQVKK